MVRKEQEVEGRRLKAPPKTVTRKATAPARKVATKTVARKAPARKVAAAPAAKKPPFGRAPGSPGVRRKKVVRKPLPMWKAPEDFKPHFLEVVLRTDKDGLFSTDIRATRYQGRYDPNADDKKKADLGSYDQATLRGILARFSAATFKPTNDKKYPAQVRGREAIKGAMRLPSNTSFKILLRVNRKAADSTLTVGIKAVWQAVKDARSGRLKAVELDTRDPVSRLLKRALRFLPAAFRDVQMPPKRTRGGRKVKDEEDDE